MSLCHGDTVKLWNCEIVPLTATEKDEELTPKRQTVVSKSRFRDRVSVVSGLPDSSQAAN